MAIEQPQVATEVMNPSLLEMHAETMVEFRGVKAPLGVLINLCPVPKEDMDPAKIETWAHNILTEAGIEVELPPTVAEQTRAEAKKK